MSYNVLADIIPGAIWELVLAVDSGDNFNTGTVDLFVDGTSNMQRVHKTISNAIVESSGLQVRFRLTAADTDSINAGSTVQGQKAAILLERNGIALVPILYANITPMPAGNVG